MCMKLFALRKFRKSTMKNVCAEVGKYTIRKIKNEEILERNV